MSEGLIFNSLFDTQHLFGAHNNWENTVAYLLFEKKKCHFIKHSIFSIFNFPSVTQLPYVSEFSYLRKFSLFKEVKEHTRLSI